MQVFRRQVWQDHGPKFRAYLNAVYVQFSKCDMKSPTFPDFCFQYDGFLQFCQCAEVWFFNKNNKNHIK